MNGNSVSARKQSAVRFLQQVVTGHVAEAYREHVDMRGKHHNPFHPAGFPALQKAMSENHIQFPDKRLTVEHVLGEGDLVVVHSHLELRPGEQGMAVVHLFRFEDGKIVEFWDCGQPLPDNSPNNDGAF